MSSPLVPIAYVPAPYVSGLQVSRASTTTLSVAAGAIRVVQSIGSMTGGGPFDLLYPNAITVDSSVNGVNGLDTGTFASSTMYNLYALGDSTSANAPGFILSTAASASSVTMPFGYDIAQLVDVGLLTDGSAHFLLFYQTGSSNQRAKQWDVPISVLSAGSSATFAAVSLATAVPLINKLKVHLNMLYVPAVATNTSNIRPTGSSAAAGSCPLILKGSVASVGVRFPDATIITLLATGNPSIDYAVTASDALTITVTGFEYTL